MSQFVVTVIDDFKAKKAKLFPTRESAMDYLQEEWEDFLNEKFANPFCNVNEEESFHEDEYAVVRYNYGHLREWHLVAISK